MSVILGIDYGDKRIGLALSDPEETLARRFLTLENSPQAIADLEEIIRENGVGKIVMGIPLGFSGVSEQTKKVEAFLAKLEAEIEIPIARMNEIFTSKMAQENLISSGVKDLKAVLDQEAARIILQDYLDVQNRNK